MEITHMLTGVSLLDFSAQMMRLQITTQATLHLQDQDRQTQGNACYALLSYA
jgi:hypothetical protein